MADEETLDEELTDEPEEPEFGLGAYEPAKDSGEFVMLIASEGSRTLDGREFSEGSIEWREPPLPVMFQPMNDRELGHRGGRVGAVIHQIWKTDDGKVYGKGFFGSHADGQEFRQLVKEGVLSGVSADVGGAVVETFNEKDGAEVKRFSKGTIMGVTAIALPAFDDTRIAVTASADFPSTLEPPVAWFGNPKLAKPTPLTVTADGQVFGHAALWGTCHVGLKQQCVTPPRSKSDYAYFNVGTVLTADAVAASTGVITMDKGHADFSASPQEAKAHYDDTNRIIAHVRTGEDEHGIWFAGALNPRATREQVATFRAASVSGDWRNIGGNLEMVGLLAVNTPGFPIPRAQATMVASADTEEPTALVAANIVENCGCGDNEYSAEVEARKAAIIREFMDLEVFSV